MILECEADNILVELSFDPAGDSGGDRMIDIANETGAIGGIAVDVLDENKILIKFYSFRIYHNSSETTITIPIFARYKQVGDITPGSANAAVTFTITQN